MTMCDGCTEAVIRDLQREQDNKDCVIRLLQEKISQLQAENELLAARLHARQQYYDGND